MSTRLISVMILDLEELTTEAMTFPLMDDDPAGKTRAAIGVWLSDQIRPETEAALPPRLREWIKRRDPEL